MRPLWEEIDTPREKIAAEYDVVIAGAGTGGWAAAVQAARMGARVLLLEETDWIGGQMSLRGRDDDGRGQRVDEVPRARARHLPRVSREHGHALPHAR